MGSDLLAALTDGAVIVELLDVEAAVVPDGVVLRAFAASVELDVPDVPELEELSDEFEDSDEAMLDSVSFIATS